MKKKCPVCLCAVDAKDSVCNFCKTPLAKSVGTSDLSSSFKPPTVIFLSKITSNSVKIPTELYNNIANEIETAKNLPTQPIKQEAIETKITFESIKELTQNKNTIDNSSQIYQDKIRPEPIQEVEENSIDKTPKFTKSKSDIEEPPSNTYRKLKESLTTAINKPQTIEKKQEIKFDDLETPLNKFDFDHHLKEESQEQKTGKLINFERIITQIKALERTNQISTPLTKEMMTSTKPRNFLQDTFDIKLDALGFVEEELDFKDLKKHMKVSLDRESLDKQLEREQSKKEELKRKHFEILKRIMRERKKKYSLKLISTFPFYIAPFEIENLEIEEIKKDKKPQPSVTIIEEERNLEIETHIISNEIEFKNKENTSFLEVEETLNEKEDNFETVENDYIDSDYSETNTKEEIEEPKTFEEVEIEEEKASFFISEDIMNTISIDNTKSDELDIINTEEIIEKNTTLEEKIETEDEVKNTIIEVNKEHILQENININEHTTEEENQTEHLESLTPVSFDINTKSDDSLIGSIFSYDSQKTFDIFVPIDKNTIFETKSLSDLIIEKNYIEEKILPIDNKDEKIQTNIELIKVVEEKEKLVINIENVEKIEIEKIKTGLNTEFNVKELERIELTSEPSKNTISNINEDKNTLEKSVQKNINEIIDNKNDVLQKTEVEEENTEIRQVIKNRLKRLSKKPTEEKIETNSNEIIVETKEDKVIEESTSKESPKFFKEDLEVKETEKTNSNEVDLVRYKADETMEAKVLEAIKEEKKTKIQLKTDSTDNNIRTTLNTTNASLMSQVQGARGTNNPEALQYYNLARDLCVKNNYLYALTQLELSVKADPAFEQAHILLSRTYLKLKSSGYIELKQ